MDETEQIGAAIRATAAGVQAPAGLRARVEAERERVGRERRRPPGVRPRAWGLVTASASAVAAVVVVLVLALGGASGPSVAQAADAALAGPLAPAPAVAPGGDRLREQVAGVTFPAWYRTFGWHSVGLRREHLDGRPARTVFYGDAGGRRIGYTIVAGEPLDVPGGAHTLTRDGTRYDVLDHDGATVVTWRRGGHTCVLAARGIPAATLVRLASW